MNTLETKANDVRTRINQLIADSGLTQNKIAAGNTQAQKRLNGQLSHGSALSLDTILRVLDAFPNVSADWLLRGKAPDNGGNISSGHSVVTAGSNNTVVNGQEKTIPEAFVRDMLAQKDKQIETLMALIGNK